MAKEQIGRPMKSQLESVLGLSVEQQIPRPISNHVRGVIEHAEVKTLIRRRVR